MDIQEVVKAATHKFGEVMNVIRIEEGEYFVACKRDNPPLKEAPYMTITALIHKQHARVAFNWGHYDLTLEEAHLAAIEALSKHGRATSKPKFITIRIHLGLFTDVTGLPEGYVLRVEDYDGGDTSHPAWNKSKRCYVTDYHGDTVSEGGAD